MGIIDAIRTDVEVAEVWAVHQGDDDRYSGKPEWWFRDEQLARDTATGRGWYGGDAPVSKHVAIILHDTELYLLKSSEPVSFGGPEDDDERREKALGKLTESEKKLLGLTA